MSAFKLTGSNLSTTEKHHVTLSASALSNELGYILIVDDNPALGETLTDILSESGHKVVLVTSGQEALRTIHTNPPELILLDLNLPDTSGHAICASLKNDPLTRFIPIVIITASSEREAELQSISAGADGYLQKPIDLVELDTRVNALLRLKRWNDTLEPAENVVFALANAVEAKDPYTQGHLFRLGIYAEAIGKRMGLSGAALNALRNGALLHDVGKVGIDEAIIRKQGPLSTSEYRAMQQHTLIGEHIVAPLRLGAVIGPIVRGHHERWDGKGYPDGLAGEAIPLGARIVAVADAFDAMTTQRPYNKVCSKREAIERLRRGKGIYWDPNVVEIFIDWLESDEYEREIGR
jgi:putative two-component system response regulator